MKVQTKFYKQRGRIDVETPASVYPSALSKAGSDDRFVCLSVSAEGHGVQRMHMSIEESVELGKRLLAVAKAAQEANERDALRKAAKAAAQQPTAAPQAAAVEHFTALAESAPAPATQAAEVQRVADHINGNDTLLTLARNYVMDARHRGGYTKDDVARAILAHFKADGYTSTPDGVPFTVASIKYAVRNL